jgi:hypothetical protein
VEYNPYDPPSASIAEEPGILDGDQAIALRKTHRGAESSLRTIGLFWLILGPTMPLFFTFMIGDENARFGEIIALSTLQVLTAGISLAVGLGLRRLRNGARICSCVLLGLVILIFAAAFFSESLDFTFLAIQSLIVVFLVTCVVVSLVPPAGRVCSGGYRSVVARTPGVSIPLSLVAKLAMIESLLVAPLILIHIFDANNASPSPEDHQQIPAPGILERATPDAQRTSTIEK